MSTHRRMCGGHPSRLIRLTISRSANSASSGPYSQNGRPQGADSRAVRTNGVEQVGVTQPDTTPVTAHAQRHEAQSRVAAVGNWRPPPGQIVHDIRLVVTRPVHVEAVISIGHENDQGLDLTGQDQRVCGLVEMPLIDPVGVIASQTVQHDQQRQIGLVAPIRRQVGVVRHGLAERRAVNGAGDHHPASAGHGGASCAAANGAGKSNAARNGSAGLFAGTSQGFLSR